MKLLMKAAPFFIMASLAAQPSYAEINGKSKQGLVTASSAIIGGLIAGPIGFIVAGVSGALLATPELPTQNVITNIDSEKSSDHVIVRDGPDNVLAYEIPPANPITNNSHSQNALSSSKEILIDSEELSTLFTQDNNPIEDNTNISSGVIEINLLFATNQFSMNPELEGNLENVLLDIKRHQNSLIHLDGYADPRGTEAFNLALSKKRAESVANYLVAKGVNRERIVLRSLGESSSKGSGNDISTYHAARKVRVSLHSPVTEKAIQNEIENSVVLLQ